MGLGRRAGWGGVGVVSSSESESSRSLLFLDSSTSALQEGTWSMFFQNSGQDPPPTATMRHLAFLS